MKNLLIGLLMGLGLFGCNEDESKTYTLKYVVFYPNYNDTVTVTNHGGYYWNSDRGTNYIKNESITGRNVYSGSAPYKILSYTLEETNK